MTAYQYRPDLVGLEVLGDAPPPTHKEQLALARRIAAGDTDARAQMITANMRLVLYWARKYLASGVDLDDLVQEGALGLISAVERFDPERGIRFATYASFWIRQALQSGVARCGRAIYIPVDAVSKAKGDDTLDSLPYATASLDRPISDDGPGTLIDLVVSDEPSPEDQAVDSLDADAVAKAVASIPDPGRSILRLRFGLRGPQLSLADVARRLGISRIEVRRLEIEALGALRSADVLAGIKSAVAVCDGSPSSPSPQPLLVKDQAS